MRLELRPGTLCHAERPLRGRWERLLLLEAQGDGFLAVPYPLEEDCEPMPVAAAELTPVGRDEASARVLAMRLRTGQPSSIRLHPSARPVRQAMVLCAGLGLRLRPLTNQFPKPALPFFGAPLVRYSFALLKGVGVQTVVINTHHLPELMERTAAREAEALGLELRVSHEPVIQGTGGALREARGLLAKEPFLLVNGDAFMALDLESLIASHCASGAAATMAVVPMPRNEKFPAVEATTSGEVRRIANIGLPGINLVPWHFIGVHVIEPEVLDFIPAQGEQDINHVVYPAMIAAGRRVRVSPTRLGAWADMGTPRRYLQACEEVMSGHCDLGSLGASAPLSQVQCRALRQAGIGGRVVVDPTARVEEPVTLERAQLGPEVSVGHGAVVRRAAVLPGTRIEAGERLEDCIACGSLRVSAVFEDHRP